MNLQYISDNKGKTTGVFIPIQEWEDLKSKYKGLEDEEVEIPEWHKDLVRKRLADYKKNPGSALDFDSAMDDIEKELNV
ncbi:MAG: addiction module protein [Bacteroidales bacterium]|nr:addiction module protein [Bacteroidales bacterium]